MTLDEIRSILSKMEDKDKTIFFSEKGNPIRLGGVVSLDEDDECNRVNIGYDYFNEFYYLSMDEIDNIDNITMLFGFLKHKLSNEGYDKYLDIDDRKLIDKLQEIAINNNAKCSYDSHNIGDWEDMNKFNIMKYTPDILEDVRKAVAESGKGYTVEPNESWGYISIHFYM